MRAVALNAMLQFLVIYRLDNKVVLILASALIHLLAS